MEYTPDILSDLIAEEYRFNICESGDCINYVTLSTSPKKEAKQAAVMDSLNQLSRSKTPVIDALIYCALSEWGLELYETKENVSIKVIDFDQYIAISNIICSKKNPTRDKNSRTKTLRRWFPKIPCLGNIKRKSKIPFIIHANNDMLFKLKGVIKRTKKSIKL